MQSEEVTGAATVEATEPSSTQLEPINLKIAVSSGTGHTNIFLYEVFCVALEEGCDSVFIESHQLTDNEFVDGFAMVSPDRESMETTSFSLRKLTG